MKKNTVTYLKNRWYQNNPFETPGSVNLESINKGQIENRFAKSGKLITSLALASALLGCNGGQLPPVQEKNDIIKMTDIPKHRIQCDGVIHPEKWQLQTSPIKRDPVIEQQVSTLLASMSLEEKVGQIIQADISAITPKEVKQYHIGSVLNGGDSAPQNNDRIEAQAWLDLADEYWLASVDKANGRTAIPIIWGTDAVHGHNNIVGATIFPHNIGLGAARNPDLIYQIAKATALEVLTTGMDWTFAPTVAIARDDRWGRTYESYSESSELVTSYAGKFMEGLQGTMNSAEFLGKDRVLGTVKHFLGDGGTYLGQDQGNNVLSEDELRLKQSPPYREAIQNGALTVMASFSSWCGQKLHGIEPLLQDVLFERMGFDGFVIGDWDAHSQLPGCSSQSCPDAFMAGIDMYMAPIKWKGLYKNLIEEVKDKRITMARLDEAVSRILRVKVRMGLFEQVKPSERAFAGQFELLGQEKHRAIARQAVRESLVLLKNNRQVLPLSGKEKILVIGNAAHDIGTQSGGWTLSWQGNDNKNSHFPNGDSILDGLKEAVMAKGGEIRFSETGKTNWQPDVVIAVYGEEPYAELKGDLKTLSFSSGEMLGKLKEFKSQDIATVSVFLSGRPLWMNKEINASDAFVAAWLPGSEGAGVADLLIQSKQSKMDFTGKLPFSWPNSPWDSPLNVDEEGYKPLFPFGYGLSYQSPKTVGVLVEQPRAIAAEN